MNAINFIPFHPLCLLLLFFLLLLLDHQADLVQCQRALKEVVAAVDAIYAKDRTFYVGFEGSFGGKHVTPRSLTSRYIGNMVRTHRGSESGRSSSGPLARPFARSLAPLTRSLAPHYSLRSRASLRSLVRSLAHFAHSLARGKANF